MIFLDLDQTLVDLFRPIARRMGRDDIADNVNEPGTYDWGSLLGIKNAALWRLVDTWGPEFWEELPWTPWGEELLDIACSQDTDVTIVSRAVTANAFAGKKLWFDACVPSGVQLHLVDGGKSFLSAPGRLLIDDHQTNCDDWRIHGGYSIVVPAPYNSQRENVGNELKYIRRLLNIFEYA